MIRRIRVYGIVQGVGFRPTVARHAQETQILGSVANKGPYVEIMAQGDEQQLKQFADLIKYASPPRSVILKMDIEDVEHLPYTSFDIIESKHTKGEIYIPPDLAICDDCARELYDPNNRRYLHPFINCTNCGPRLTILEGLPYDRERTSMKEFPMCEQCASEYHDPASRRYDAQPVCCNSCGPHVYILDTDCTDREAIVAARQALASGRIVAIKGIGGFHLACDAFNEQAVTRLRSLKHRPAKPFAVMARDLATAQKIVKVSENAEKVLTGHQKPICLLEKNEDILAKSVAPDNPMLGVMLPYAPLQLLLFKYDDEMTTPSVLVMTSANDSGVPITHNDEEARHDLKQLSDVILSHNRKIRVRCDDSVMSFYHDQPYMIRRSRGYAPLPYILKNDFQGEVLAIGGELKNTFCIGKGKLFYPSSYIGDLSQLASVEVLKNTISLMAELLETKPSVVACDRHPQYNSRLFAESLGRRTIYVQHHYAHIVSCMAENDYDQPVIGVSFDGTGYGDDGTIWGGELMICDYHGYQRVGHIRPFYQIGGDLSAKEGWRNAISMIIENKYLSMDDIISLKLCDEKTLKIMKVMHEKKLNSVLSTSAGRLFDAVSAILGICRRSSFEGEASMALQYAALKGAARQVNIKTDPLQEDGYVLPIENLIAYIVNHRLNNENVNQLAYDFHQALAMMIVKTVLMISRETGISAAALSGGVFQNTLLLEMVKEQLEKNHINVLIHHLIPPNDGGICLGQAVVAMTKLNEERK